jgi:hypothetical protein
MIIIVATGRKQFLLAEKKNPSVGEVIFSCMY